MASPDRNLNTPVRFRAGGVLRPGDLYIRRSIDERALRVLREGEIVFALGSRQTGKSSLLRQLQRQLGASHRVAVISLDTPTTTDDGAQFAESVIDSLFKALAIDESESESVGARLRVLAPGLRIERVFEHVTKLDARPLVVLFDEVDSTQRLPKAVASDFWVSCRAVWQSLHPRVTFGFFGVMDPDLVAHDRERTPFNIGQRLSLDELPRDNFDLEQLRTLSDDPGKFLDEVFEWTAGHPYLTQKVFVARQDARQKSVEQHVREVFLLDGLTSDSCLRSVDNQFRGSSSAREDETALRLASARDDDREIGEMLAIYQRIRRAETVTELPADRVKRRLALAGLTAPRQTSSSSDRVLAPRNRIFESVFDDRWIEQKLSSLSRPLLDQTLRWIANQRNDSDLLRGAALEEAERHIASTPDITNDERQFVTASRVAADAEAARRRRSARLVGGVIVLLSVAGTVTSAWFAKEAVQQRDNARQERAAAQDAGELARVERDRAEDAGAAARAERDRAEDARVAALAAESTAQHATRVAQAAQREEMEQRRKAERAGQFARSAARRAEQSEVVARRNAVRAEAQALARLASDSVVHADTAQRTADATRDYPQLETETVSAEERGTVLESLSRAVRSAWDSPVVHSRGGIGPIQPGDSVELSTTGEQLIVVRAPSAATTATPTLLRWTEPWSGGPSQAFRDATPREVQWEPRSNTLFVSTDEGALYRWPSGSAPSRMIDEGCPIVRVSRVRSVLCVDGRADEGAWCSLSGACTAITTAPAVQWRESNSIAVASDARLLWLAAGEQSVLLRASSQRDGEWLRELLSVSSSARLADIRYVTAVDTHSAGLAAWISLDTRGDVVRWSTDLAVPRPARWRSAALQFPENYGLAAQRVVPAPDGYGALVLSAGRVALLSFDPRFVDETDARVLPGRDWVGVGWRDNAPVAISRDGSLHHWRRSESWSIATSMHTLRWTGWGTRDGRARYLATIDDTSMLTVRDADTARRIASFSADATSRPVWNSQGALAWTARNAVFVWSGIGALRSLPVGFDVTELQWFDTRTLQLVGDNGARRSLDIASGRVSEQVAAPCVQTGYPLREAGGRRVYDCAIATDGGSARQLFMDRTPLGAFNFSRLSAAAISGATTLWVGVAGIDGLLRFGQPLPSQPTTIALPTGSNVDNLDASATHLAALLRNGESASVWLRPLSESRTDASTWTATGGTFEGNTLLFQWLDEQRLLVATTRRIMVIDRRGDARSIAFEPSSGVFRHVASSPSGDRIVVTDSHGTSRIIALSHTTLAQILPPPSPPSSAQPTAMFVRPSITAQMIRFIRGNYREFCRNQ
jgi:hypothetical protein